MQKPEKSALLGFQGAVKASKQKACHKCSTLYSSTCRARITFQFWHQIHFFFQLTYIIPTRHVKVYSRSDQSCLSKLKSLWVIGRFFMSILRSWKIKVKILFLFVFCSIKIYGSCETLNPQHHKQQSKNFMRKYFSNLFSENFSPFLWRFLM